MKLSLLFIAGLTILGSVFASMTDKTPITSSVIDEIEVTDLSIPSTTVYYVERSAATPGSVVIDGTLTDPPVPNQNGGKNYKCTVSSEICYECDNCKEIPNPN